MLIYVVRHGETNANVKGYLQGWTNDPLNENGKNLAIITGQGMRGIRFDCCISSPLIRARETAEIILHESGNDIPIFFEDRIKEINMGSWERKKFRPGEREVDENEIKMFFTDPFHFAGCPEGETIAQVCERTQAFLKELIARDDDKTYLVTTHGFALRGMLNFLYEDPSDYWHGHVPYNCSVTVVRTQNSKAWIETSDKVFYGPDQIVDRYKRR